MTGQPPPVPRPGPGGMAESCGHRRSVTVPGGPLVVAGVSGSPGSVHALRYAADLARRHGAALVPVLAWVPPGGDMAEHKYPDPELRRLWKQDAWQRLRGAIGTAFGGYPHGVRTWPLVLRGAAGPELVGLASQPGDLLVIGAGRRTALTRLACCPVARHCLAHAHCPVLAVPPPDLAQQVGHGLRGWAFRTAGSTTGSARRCGAHRTRPPDKPTATRTPKIERTL
jgi:nucleotide-binding universal stress UspA family protein